MNQSIAEFLSRYKPGQYIYASAVKRATGADALAIITALQELVKCGKVGIVYETHCPKCGSDFGGIYRGLLDIPSVMYCDNCDSDVKITQAEISALYRALALNEEDREE